MSEPLRAEIDVEVRYVETDQMGVVHHASYIVWFEIARTRLCALAGFHYADIEKMGYLLMVTGVEASYRRSARYGDVARVVCWNEQMTSRTLRFAYEITRGDEILVTGATDHVWVEAATGRPCRIPDLLREPFRKLAAPSPGS
jgi:acyl-CoA thioester hydrolase